jgi:hypothetical protein
MWSFQMPYNGLAMVSAMINIRSFGLAGMLDKGALLPYIFSRSKRSFGGFRSPMLKSIGKLAFTIASVPVVQLSTY